VFAPLRLHDDVHRRLPPPRLLHEPPRSESRTVRVGPTPGRRARRPRVALVGLRREGTHKRPHYRIVAADSRSPRNGRFIEILGEYHPLDDPSTIVVDRDRALYWLGVGAQPSSQVEKLLRIEGIWEEFKPGDEPKRVREGVPTTKQDVPAAQPAPTPATSSSAETSPAADEAASDEGSDTTEGDQA
jgi:small subunit ribosomal protein S16